MYKTPEMRYGFIMLSSTDTALVRLYYENFGLSIPEISGALGLSRPIVNSLVEEHQMVAPEVAKLNEDKRAAIAARDLDKQLILEPYYTRAEVVVLAKLTEVALSIDKNDIDAAQRLTACSKALKDLRSVGVQAKLDSQSEAAGVTVQILNQL